MSPMGAHVTKKSHVPWANKLRAGIKPRVCDDPKGGGTLLLPTPLLVAEEISRVRKGTIITVAELRDRMAKRFDADRAGPLMTGIFINIVAGAAEEAIAAGQKPLAPYWRIVRDDGTLSPKTPPAPERQAQHLRVEGHRVSFAKGTLRLV